MRLLLLISLIFLTACTEQKTVSPGRGVEREVGPVAKIYPAGEEPRIDRHGLWRGINGDRVVWEVRYIRGLPTGAYRQWNSDGELIATWPYSWEGIPEKWARWYHNEQPEFKWRVKEQIELPFDPIGRAGDFKAWCEKQPANS